MIRQIDQDVMDKILAADDDVNYMVNFSAPWCGPCRAFAPIYEELSNHYADSVAFAKVEDVASLDPATVTELGIRGVPTFALFKNGEEIFRSVGAGRDALIEGLESL